ASWVRIGTGNGFSTSGSLVTDSTPPIVSRAVFTNNICASSQNSNYTDIYFSEPLKAGQDFSNWRSRVLFASTNPKGQIDSSFLANTSVVQSLEARTDVDGAHPLESGASSGSSLVYMRLTHAGTTLSDSLIGVGAKIRFAQTGSSQFKDKGLELDGSLTPGVSVGIITDSISDLCGNSDVAFDRYELYQNVNPNISNFANILMPGKPFRIKIRVLNKLAQNLLTLEGKLRTLNSFVKITDSIASFNNVASGQQGWSSDEFEITLNDSVPLSTTVTFILVMKDQLVAGSPWSSSFTIPITPFSIPQFLVDDDNNPDSRGNNNKIIEPNENAELIPIVSNVSTNSFYGLYGRLFSLTPNIDIWNNKQGSSEMVYDSARYNVVFGAHQNVSPNQNSITPEVDYVFSYNNTRTYKTKFVLMMEGYLNGAVGTNWSTGSVKHRWGVPFYINAGYPDTIENSIGTEKVLAQNKVYTEFYLSASPNPFN
ncbi:MAG: hypothetical protein JNL74_20005, partial [Fibrobacteres bacterium]|nr:hypothetical protein [Fibrobacterota bacterium]